MTGPSMLLFEALREPERLLALTAKDWNGLIRVGRAERLLATNAQ